MTSLVTADEPRPAARYGQCLCGAVRFRMLAEPLTVYACHCTDCQRLSAGACAIAAIVPQASIEILSGDPARYRAELSAGRMRHGRFCRDCATRLWGISQRQPELAVVYVGTLDDASGLQPAAHLWVRSAQPWLHFAPDTPTYATQPEDPSMLVTHWRKQRGRIPAGD